MLPWEHSMPKRERNTPHNSFPSQFDCPKPMAREFPFAFPMIVQWQIAEFSRSSLSGRAEKSFESKFVDLATHCPKEFRPKLSELSINLVPSSRFVMLHGFPSLVQCPEFCQYPGY